MTLCKLSNIFRLLSFEIRESSRIFKVSNYEIISCNVKYSQKAKMVRVLNVAEKNDAAKSISGIMSHGGFQRREGESRFNKIYEFEYNVFNQRCRMIMTSVSGHLLNLEFSGAYRKWQACNPVSLFDAPVIMDCMPDYQPIKKTLELQSRNCQYLIIWTDGDREGENIGFEIIEVCKKVQPNIKVFRARFSEITPQAISRACANLVAPDKRMSDAVNVRRELDLRIGASFTRFQTLRLSKVFPDVLDNKLISYGSCQFPTLGFVVERYKQVQAFIPEAFWKIKVTHKKEEVLTEFSWKRGRLFDHTSCLVLYQMCLEEPTAKIVDIRSRNKSKWRPQPLDTVEFEKLSSRKLRINAKQAMSIAEKLYTKGFISYPRTETTIFPKELDLTSLVEMQREDRNWGEFAGRVLADGPNPRQGTKTDNAHPPIHPTKYTDTLQDFIVGWSDDYCSTMHGRALNITVHSRNNQGNDQKVYELVVRHFLACVSKDAEGRETTIEIEVNKERFAVNGLMIIAKNYLDVYIYEKWNAKIIGQYDVNEEFQPSSIEMNEGETSAPELLTEADLIGLMEKHGIGTDATHAEHIETIKSRLYVGLNENNRFVPGELGMGLVEGYDLMGFHMSKPHLRAELEADLKRITEGTKNPEVVLREQVSKYKECFIEVVRQASKLDTALSTYLDTSPNAIAAENSALPELVPIMKCPKCKTGDIVLRNKKDNKGFFLSCLSYPGCNAAIWLPQSLEEISVTDQECERCQPRAVKKLKFKFRAGSLVPFYPDSFVNCLGGCDTDFMETIDARPITASNSNRSTTSSFSSRNASLDSGYESNHHSAASNSRNNSSITQRSNSVSSVVTGSQQGPLSSNRQQPGQNNMSSSPDIYLVCFCRKRVVVLTVRKEGPNKGRQFYKCPEVDGVKCGFFLWVDDGNMNTEPQYNSNNRQDSTSMRPSSSNVNPGAGDIPMCRCPEQTVLRTVVKDGPNKGRQFFVCPKPQDQSCRFFQWADEDSVNSFNQNQSSGFNQPSTNFARRRPAGSSSGGPAAKRKCGICHQTGHNRKSCPCNR